MPLEETSTIDSAAREKTSAAVSSIFAALGLVVMKLIVGLWTGSLGLLAEAAHSGLDLVAAFVTYLAVRISDKPPDDTHLYGHGKIENFSALIETILLFITCAWIIYEAVRRLFFKTVEIEPSLWAFIVIVISILVDINRSRRLSRTARKYRSQALEADALHFSTDIWSSSVVLAGLGLVWLGRRVFPAQAALLNRADAVAALGVALIILFVSYKLGRRTIDVLLDRAPEGVSEKIMEAVTGLEGILSAGRLRVRRSGARTFVDLNVAIDRTLPFEQTHTIAETVEAKIREIVPDADVIVQTDPGISERETIARRIRVLADRNQIPVHNIKVLMDSGRICVDLHLEVDEHLSLHEAHDLAHRVEKELMAEIPEIGRVNTHIEARVTGVGETSDVTAKNPRMVAEVMRVTDAVAGKGRCHNVVIRRQGAKFAVSLHCRLPREAPVGAAHGLATKIEEALKIKLPDLDHVLVHTEPESNSES